MRIFISAGEPSGDVHAGNLIRSLQRQAPGVECVGFGGERMEAAGGKLLYPLCQLAVMWFARVLANAHVFLQLVSQADRYFRHHRPDAVVLIDYPGFNWWLARRAHFHGIPVFYFVPPQLWAWAGWRVRKMRRWVDHVLCSLPFEEGWYLSRGVAARYVGHPFFDELTQQRLDADFIARHRSRPGPIVGILPGSRTQELDRNLSTLVRAAQRIQAERPDVRFLVANFKESQQRQTDDYLRGHPLEAETHVGRTPEIMHLAHSCLAVSGSVGLELLYHVRPTVVVYRIRKLDLAVSRHFITSPFISIVNLLAQREIFPEFLTNRCEAEAMSGHVLRWLNEPAAYAQTCRELRGLRELVARPGACDQAARSILETRANPKQKPHVA